METSWYTSTHPNRAALYLLYTSLCTGELNAIRKHNCFLCSPFYVKGVSLGYVGRIETLNTSPLTFAPPIRNTKQSAIKFRQQIQRTRRHPLFSFTTQLGLAAPFHYEIERESVPPAAQQQRFSWLLPLSKTLWALTLKLFFRSYKPKTQSSDH